jgi:hypothetical protein
MKNGKANGSTANGSTKINPSSEMDIEGNIRQLGNSDDTLHQIENRDVEMSTSTIDTMLRRVREASSREIEDLIDDLQQLQTTMAAVFDATSNITQNSISLWFS